MVLPVGERAGRLGADFKAVGTGLRDSAVALKDSLTRGGGTLGRMASGATSLTLGALQIPVKAAAWLSRGTTGKIAVVGAGALAVMGVGGFLRNRAMDRTQAEAVDRINHAQQMGQAQANTYQITPQEYEAMQARMRVGGQNGGFAQGIQQARAAAAVPGTQP